jgi:hypothetical protein
MITPFLAAALALQAAPAPAQPPAAPSTASLDQLTPEQATAARCAIAFAAVGRWQKADDPRGASYPDMVTGGGREFFVQVMAKLMGEAGLSRDDVIALAARGAEEYDKPEGAQAIAALMPTCQAMKSAAGL